jgi:putative ABC transport system permease protein
VAFAATTAAAVAATILPSWIARRTRASTAIQSTSRSAGHSRPVLRILRGIVVAQVAATFVLAVGGGLLARSLVSLTQVDPGFDAAGVHTLRINLPLTMAGRTEPQRIFYADALDRARALPGVVSAGYAARLPLSTVFAGTEISRADGPEDTVEAALNMASDGYFSTIGTALVAGRDFETSDSTTTPAVVVNEVLARQLFPGGGAVGQRVRIRPFGRQIEATIIGISEALRYDGLTAAPEPEVILDYRVRPMILRLFVKADGTTDDIVPMLRTAVRQADPTGRVTFDEITSLEREVARHLARPRFYLALLGAFGLSALALAATGLYGVMSFAVEARRHDFGVRLALGASPGRIFREILRHGASLTAAGLCAGALAAYVLTGVLQALLYDITPRDTATFAGTSAVVALVALLASWLPARMARSTDPLAVMRSD